jgi:hypothetical protein
MFDIDHNKNRIRAVLFEEFMNFDIMRFELGSCDVPSDDFFLSSNLRVEDVKGGLTFLNIANIFSW